MLAAAFLPSLGLALADSSTDPSIDALLTGEVRAAARSRVYSVQSSPRLTSAGRAVTLAPKDPGETIAIACDFSALCTSIDLATVVCEVVDGPSDAAASAMLLGRPIVRDTRVTQLVRGGIDGTAYSLRITIDSGPLRLVETALIRVAAQH